MAGLTQTEQQATLDARFPTTGGTDYIAYSANGTSETASLARTAIGATYRVACRITTSGGNIDERTKKIMVRNR